MVVVCSSIVVVRWGRCSSSLFVRCGWLCRGWLSVCLLVVVICRRSVVAVVDGVGWLAGCVVCPSFDLCYFVNRFRKNKKKLHHNTGCREQLGAGTWAGESVLFDPTVGGCWVRRSG